MKKKATTIRWPEAESYRDLYKTAAATPDEVAYEYKKQRVTYKELVKNVNRLAEGLGRTGLQKGDRIIVSLPDIPQAIECHYAMEKEGLHEYNLQPGVKAAAVAVIADEINCKAIVTVDANYEELARAIAGLDYPVQIILADIKVPKLKVKKSLFRKIKRRKYASDEHITPWSELIRK